MLTRIEKREFLKAVKEYRQAVREERRAARAAKEHEKQERKAERERAQAERRASDERVSEAWRRQREERGFPYFNFDEVAPLVRAGTFGTMAEFAAHYKLSPSMANWLGRIVRRRSGMKDAEWRAYFAETRKKRRKAAQRHD